MATNFEPKKCTIFVRSEKNDTNENKDVNSRFDYLS